MSKKRAQGIHEVDVMNWQRRLEKRIPPTEMSKAKTAEERRMILEDDIREYFKRRGRVTTIEGPPDSIRDLIPPSIKTRPPMSY